MTLTIHQTRVIHTFGVRHIGYDSKNRPVVSMMTGIPHQLRTWAILRNGNPTDITEPVRKV